MNRIRITLKNYRAFSDEEPLHLEVGPGFTAIVGRNNSGKSAAKLFFYEFRHFFTMMSSTNVNPGLRQVLALGARPSVQYLGITDAEEVLNNTNSRPATVDISVVDAASSQADSTDALQRIVATCDRLDPRVWTFNAFGKKEPDRELARLQPNHVGGNSTTLVFQNNPRVDCTDFMRSCELLSQARYYGPFRNAINQGSGEYFDLQIGTSFIDLWNEWKTSGIKQKSRAIDQVTDDIKRLFEFERLEITASGKLKTLIVTVDGQSYRLNELGSGLAQFIIALGNAATNPPSLMLIDEPETNLHPSLQIDFLLSLGRYARAGVIFSTHSLGLARSVADRIYSVQKVERNTVVRPFESTPNYSEFAGELSFSAFKDLGSDRILLVEGVNDVKTVQQLLRLVRKEHTTVVLPLGGDQLASGREQELSELKRLSDNIFALVDSERVAADAPMKPQRQQFLDVCGKLGFHACVTERRAIENYFTERAVKAALGDSFAAPAPFEALKVLRNPWSKGDNWKIARQMELSELDGTDVGALLMRL